MDKDHQENEPIFNRNTNPPDNSSISDDRQKVVQSITSPQPTFNIHKFSRDVVIYTLGQSIILVINFVLTIVLAKYLPITDYGYWQLFILYANYVGILHLGFVDGILLQWAGKDISEFSINIKSASVFLMLEQVILCPLAIIVLLLVNPGFHLMAILLIVFAFIANLGTFFNYTLQCLRKFKHLALMNITICGCFLLSILLMLAIGNLNEMTSDVSPGLALNQRP
jgi:O-antigen/teichoic acid export membrane protein